MNKSNLFSLVVLLSVIQSCGTTKSTIPASERDGSSFKKAIVVKSVTEEYQFVQKVCRGCQFVGQSLVTNIKKPYDILRFRNPDGEEIKYYFDISKFYGKRY
jgi:hypothetical protein